MAEEDRGGDRGSVHRVGGNREAGPRVKPSRQQGKRDPRGDPALRRVVVGAADRRKQDRAAVFVVPDVRQAHRRKLNRYEDQAEDVHAQA